MKSHRLFTYSSGTFVLLASAVLCHADYHTNTITTPEPFSFPYYYAVDGKSDHNPVIDLIAGVTNILDVHVSSFHPVVVTTNIDTSAWYDGANPQGVDSQPITITTPTTGFPTVLYYMCEIHGFYGEIHLSGPTSPMPPPNTILQIRVGANVVMTSTGTDTTWNLIPEFSSNLVSGSWTSVPSFTNTYANGTNTTVFDRLDPICGPNVFLRIRQSP